MKQNAMYENIQRSGGSTNILGIITLNILLIIVTTLFVTMVIKAIRKIAKNKDILKGPLPHVIATLVLYVVFVGLQLSVLL